MLAPPNYGQSILFVDFSIVSIVRRVASMLYKSIILWIILSLHYGTAIPRDSAMRGNDDMLIPGGSYLEESRRYL